MGQARNRGTKEERIRAAAGRKAAKRAQTEAAERKWREDVADAIKKHGLDLGIITGCRQRIVAVRFDDLVRRLDGLLEKIPCEPAELIVPGDPFVDDFGPQDKQEEGK